MSAAAGLYVHVPFCRTRCPFCSFAITTELGSAGAWLEALRREVDLRAADWRGPFDTVYLGGGTPSLLGPGQAGEVLDLLRSRFEVLPGAEVTLEENPGTLGPGDHARLLEAGFNRLSLGVQSLREEDLRLLGRDHTAADSREAYERARREGFRSISLDLIWGLPGRSAAEWRQVLEEAAALGPEHLSAYQLTWEPGTALTARKERGELREPTEEEAEELFLLTHEVCEQAGFVHYEVSSFARPRHESRHNLKYWEGAPYLGLGPSAHSFRDGARSWNTPGTARYLDLLGRGEDPRAGEERLPAAERRLERLFLALRTAGGLRLDRFQEEFGLDLLREREDLLRELESRGLVVIEPPTLRPTVQGLAVADAIALELSRLP